MADELYNKKLESLQQYIPFLDNMIIQLKDPNKKNREQQLTKMQSLHSMITDKRKKLKLETLVKCEDVISKLYEKVHNKPIYTKKMFESSSTPASPSPPRDINIPKPLTIPTERLVESRIPKIDIYTSAAESLSRARVQHNIPLATKVPDMSKPPISLEDLKTLEDDVHEKINESCLKTASLFELHTLKEKLTEQIQMEEGLITSPQKSKKNETNTINTTVRNNLNLTKKIIQPPDKSKNREKLIPLESSPCKSLEPGPSKPLDCNPGTSSPKKENKMSITPVSKSPKILKETSIFGSILSHIDDQILEVKKKKEERRNSLTGKDDKKLSEKNIKKVDRKYSISKDDTNDDKKDKDTNIIKDEKRDKDVKKKERDSGSIEGHKLKDEKKNKDRKDSESKKERRHHSADKSKCKEVKNEGNCKEDKHKHSPKEKCTSFALTGKTSIDAEEAILKNTLEAQKEEINTVNENNEELTVDNKNKELIGKITVKKDLAAVNTNYTDVSAKPTIYKRLADKYHPKPRKPVTEPDVDKELSDIIEEKMKTSPPKIPVINQIPAPIPPPPSLIICSQAEPEKAQEPATSLPPVLQNILTPGTTELINTMVSQLRQQNEDTDTRQVQAMPARISNENISNYAEDNFISEYIREDFARNNFSPNAGNISDFNNFQSQSQHQASQRERLNYEPPSPVSNNQFNQVNPQNQRFMPPRAFTPAPQNFTQPYNNFQTNQGAPSDIQPLDYYPPNAPIPANQYNCGPPLLSPEVPYFHTEPKPGNFGMMPHDSFGYNDDMRWRQEDNRFLWDRREQDFRINRDPRTYREYREMRESRDPRTCNRDPRDNRDISRDPRMMRDPRVNRDLRENRDPRERDPRLNKDREFDRGRPRFQDSRSQTRDTRSNRYDNNFDRVYSRTNRDRSASRSRLYSNETFTSPLDSLYSGKEEHKTGKGYGFQNFRIPKIKKEDEENDQSTKVSSSNEESSDPVQTVNSDSTDSVNNEVTGNDIGTEEVEKTGPNEVTGSECEKESHETKEDEKDNQEFPLVQEETEEVKSAEATKSINVTRVEQEEAKPADQTILAQFFANLLGSKNKKDKKTALYSLISTFSDSFSEKELSKITKIIKADDEAGSSEEEEGIVKPEHKQFEASKESEIEAVVEETSTDENLVKVNKRRGKKRLRRISSTSSLKDEKNKEEEISKTPEPPEILNMEEESVVVSVGERIKSRRRNVATPQKPKKKCKTELDMLHEDIQDMFIRDGVLTASGKRMCRLLKSDPNVLTTPQKNPPAEPQKIRKKPGPKPKQRSNSVEMRSVKTIRVLIPKIPDDSLEQKEENSKRTLRSSTKPTTYVESDEDTSIPADDDSVLEGSLRAEDSDVDSTDTEKDKLSQISDGVHKTKTMKRKRGKGWASGNIPSNKRKRKKQEVTDFSSIKDSSTVPSETDKSFVEPDKNQYVDFTSKVHKCTLCEYKGRFITTHYKMQHPESEVLTSRFSPAVAQEAINDSKKNLANYESIIRTCGSGKYHFTCRFCAFNTTVPPTIFYDHITTHTGEYRHVCPMCDFSASSGKTLKSHMSSSHDNIQKRIARKSYSQTIIFAYMCGECNYVQMTRKNVEDHINIFHLQKPQIYKVNMSTTMDPEVSKVAEKDLQNDLFTPPVIDEEKIVDKPGPKSKKIASEIEDKPMPPPLPRKRMKPAPKSVKEKLVAKQAIREKDENFSDTSSFAESPSDSNTDSETSPKKSPVKRRLTRETLLNLEEEFITSGRGRRAAKDKAAEKLKNLMEFSENSSRKKSISSPVVDDKNKNDNIDTSNTHPEGSEQVLPKLVENKEEPPKIKKEIELNVFTCKTDLQEENKKIEQERLQLMDELNKSVGSRTSLNFVDKLCNRLSKNDIIVKQEPRDDLIESLSSSNHQNQSPVSMPLLEKNLPLQSNEPGSTKSFIMQTIPPKKPVLEVEDIQVSNSSFDVTQKNDKVITDMIQKLKGKLANAPTIISESNSDNKVLPVLTHVNKLPNIKPADESTKTLLIGGLVKVIKYPNHLLFSCLVPPCVFLTENKDMFKKHCSEAHKLSLTTTLCEMCGLEIMIEGENTLLESVFQHGIDEHSDFMTSELTDDKDFVKPPNTLLRIRKLSGDALSITKDWEEEIDNTPIISDDYNSSPSEVAISDSSTLEEPLPTMAELEMSEDNPFPFKIAGVMSLAEPPPPLAPLAKTSLLTQTASQLVVKEARLTQSELNRPRKTPKAMAKFISSVSDLYKCPHYYCLFSTNFRDFLERHLKAHKVEHDYMIPCVYCDMKTPWEHVPMHIDIRHAHCRFACSYCLYRAVLKEYVFLHQDHMHPESDYSVIALPQPKSSKKFAIADVKPDPKKLCEPYKCTTVCGMEFLFENEFKRHLQDVHKSNFIPCGFKNCSHRVQAIKMPNHWALNHGIATYQCGYCKVNSSDMKKLYSHFAQYHQGLVPDILIRKLTQLKEGVYLGYTQEAFAQLRKVVTIPNNISGDDKAESLSTDSNTVPITVTKNSTPPSKPTLQIVTSLPQNTPKSILIPSNTSIINRAITLVSTSSSTCNANNFVIVPNITSSGTTLTSPQITSVASIDKPSQVVNTVIDTLSAIPNLQQITITSKPKCSQAANKDIQEESGTQEVDTDIAPLEHIMLGEDSNPNNEVADGCEADPLSLDTDIDMNDVSKSAAESSGDESDGSKLDKSKKETQTGLTSYQLYRCSFCDISFSNSTDFKRHATYSTNCRLEGQVAKPFICVHCKKQLKSPSMLMEHVQCHGVLRFTCSLCGNKFSTIGQTRNHIKNRHNITHTSMTPLNPSKQNIENDEYLVRPKLLLQMGGEAAPVESSTSSFPSDNVFTPETIDNIPMRHILSSSVRCGLCSYTTKVRTNMVRHLQFHSEEKAVPDTAPVNPVPCLEKNEKMFDKMINLASSSHTNSRMGVGKPEAKEKETEQYPEFVPSHCRYVCCAHGCNYICPEEGNLRHHLIALHDNETSFTCVHCKRSLSPTDADSLIKHFKQHSLQLHKCNYCSFIHHLKHKIEKHVVDSHLDLPVKVITIRSMDSEPKDSCQEASTSNSQTIPAPPTKIFKPWRCCMCKYKTISHESIMNHVLEKHEIDSQFKCALCSYKTNESETFPEHFKVTHDNQAVDVIYAYRKLEEEKDKDMETFDTTPLWQRDRPRVRHIRGILFDESSPTPTKSPKKAKSTQVTPILGSSGVKNSTSSGPSILKTATPSSVSDTAQGPSHSGSSEMQTIISSRPNEIDSLASTLETSSLDKNMDQSIESVVNGTADILKESSAPISDDFFQKVNKMMKDSCQDITQTKDSMVIVIDDEDEPNSKAPMVKNKDNKNAPTAKNRSTKRKAPDLPAISKVQKITEEIIDLESNDNETDTEFSERSLRLEFGAYGTPFLRQFKCPVCHTFKSKRICNFIFHLFKEMKVFRFECKLCKDLSITYRYMYNHIKDEHWRADVGNYVTTLPRNDKLLMWLQMVVREQSTIILQNFPKMPQPAVATTNQQLVQCEFCNDSFKSEQEKNEHSVMHWKFKPYECSECLFASYGEQQVLRHFKSVHREKALLENENTMVDVKGATVEKLLTILDDQHSKEFQIIQIPNPVESPVMTSLLPVREISDPLGDISISDQVSDPLAVNLPLHCDEVLKDKNDDAVLSDSDLIIVTKTDSVNIPTEDDIFCCEYCQYMANSEVEVLSHITAFHAYMPINFKKLNKVTCQKPEEHVGCMWCSEIGSEVKIRQHHMEKHEGLTFSVYKFQCSLCPKPKKFLKFMGLKVHFNRSHAGCKLQYTTLYSNIDISVSKTSLKIYKCPICPYERTLKTSAINNVRQHLRQHFKAYQCGICMSTKYKTRSDVISHYTKSHPDAQSQEVVQDNQLLENYNVTMSELIAAAVDVQEPVVKNTARKSTSAASCSSSAKEYSFYGQPPEKVDLSKIMTSVEVNGMRLDMSAEKLSKIFDLDVTVALEDCNLSLNLSNVFDS